ncbi:MAG: 1-phosphofructokinase family hexose kinase [Novosphingobium sp.]|nr:1-phosphofructokinase family hexose kinase [Novosphingobium sp.]
MKSIATLTMNPTIDVAYETDCVRPTLKMRTRSESYAPGGGGINVARVFVRLGGNARCIYLSGGATGPAFDGLVDLHQLVRTRIPIEGHTRVATTARDAESGQEYRFTPGGPTVSESEWQACLDSVATIECGFLVASGSLPPGVPTDFYVRVAKIARDRGIGFVLDTSGAPLKQALAAGGILLAKPSHGEFAQLIGRKPESPADIANEAQNFVRDGKVEMLAVTMGHRGAVLATRDATVCLRAIDIAPQSAVGAGDSFVAGMVHRLACGDDPRTAFRYGMAAGSAAVLTPGSSLAYPEDIARLLPSVPLP